MAKNDLQGALDLLILKTLSQLGSMHGYGIVMHIRRVSDEPSSSRKARSTLRCTAWNRAVGSAPTGRSRTMDAKPSGTLSPAPAARS